MSVDAGAATCEPAENSTIVGSGVITASNIDVPADGIVPCDGKRRFGWGVTDLGCTPLSDLFWALVLESRRAGTATIAV